MVNKKNLKLPRACRKAAVELMKDERDEDIVSEFLAPFAELERKTYEKWFLKMSRDVNDLRVDPETYAYQLVLKIRNEQDVNLEKIVALGEKRMMQQQQEGHRPSRMLGQVVDYAKVCLAKRQKFYDYAVPFMLNLDYDGLKKAIAAHEESARRRDEDQLFQLQVLKHVRNLQEYEKPIPVELLRIALQTEFSANRKILDVQCLLIYHIYDSQCDKPLLVKQMCFDFIREVLTKITGHVTLVHWLFLDDWISKETHDLLIDAYPMLCKLGMESTVYYKARKLYDTWHLERRSEEELTTPEKFVVDIITLYAKDGTFASPAKA